MLETVLIGLLGAGGGAATAAAVLRLALLSEIRAVVERELERERVAMRATYASREDFIRIEGKFDALSARMESSRGDFARLENKLDALAQRITDMIERHVK